jgi:hypothetical protein
MMKAFSMRMLACTGILVGGASAQKVSFSDDFDDGTNSGWTYLNRNGAEEIADALWVETGGRLEQQTPNYDFPRDTTVNDPVLGAIALAPQTVGGHYSLSAEFTSLEPGNTFQDQDFVFGYLDENNFFMLETIPSGLNVFQVVDGDRMLVAQGPIAFTHAPNTVVLEHNAETGEVIATYGNATPVIFSDPAFIREGSNQVGVGSNNDAFAIDHFTITQLGSPVPELSLEITSFTYDPKEESASLSWASEAGVLYTVSRSFDLKLWDDLEDSVVGLVGTTNFSDFATGSKAFYRVSITPTGP